MAELKNAKYIVYDTKPFPPEMVGKIKDRQKDIKSTIKSTRMLWMDDDMVKGATFYMECVWLWSGSVTGSTEEPHVHDFDEMIGFVGCNPESPHDLDGEIELWLEDEKYIITKSCLVFIPKGLKHCPMIFKRINKPVLLMTIGNRSIYGRESKKEV
jgi:hypothetical protein